MIFAFIPVELIVGRLRYFFTHRDDDRRAYVRGDMSGWSAFVSTDLVPDHFANVVWDNEAVLVVVSFQEFVHFVAVPGWQSSLPDVVCDPVRQLDRPWFFWGQFAHLSWW